MSEIVGLSSQTKFSEEQIKVWFSAQRLKHGVSWTPEEVGTTRFVICDTVRDLSHLRLKKIDRPKRQRALI